MPLAAEFEVERDEVVALAGQRGFGAVAVAKGLDAGVGPRSAQPGDELVSGGRVVFDHGNADGHAAMVRAVWRCRAEESFRGRHGVLLGVGRDRRDAG